MDTHLKKIIRIKFELFTFKKGTYFPPAGYTSLLRVLAEGSLQEKDRDAASKQEQHIRNEEHTLEKQTGERSCLNVKHR